jgi:hypothetical protein
MDDFEPVQESTGYSALNPFPYLEGQNLANLSLEKGLINRSCLIAVPFVDLLNLARKVESLHAQVEDLKQSQVRNQSELRTLRNQQSYIKADLNLYYREEGGSYY